MAGDFAGPGHRIVSGEAPTVGLEVYTNEYRRGVITQVADPIGLVTCGWYCEAWHEVTYPATESEPARKIKMNCDRLSTRLPR